MMTLPLDAREAAKAAEITTTERQVEKVAESYVRAREAKQELRRALLRRQIDAELWRQSPVASAGKWRGRGLLALGGLLAFLIVIWFLGPAGLSMGGRILVAGAAVLGLGLAALFIAALTDRIGGKPIAPPETPIAADPASKDEALRRLS
ncbi:hypothetical protein [Dongia sp.]|uniref:hypothetical protein n=1 Tax=Dongia sp. TaxID=1977262 RepID=UPI0035AF1F64